MALQEIRKQVILESVSESIQLLKVKSYPLLLPRVPPVCHFLFMFTARTLITSHVELMNRAALVPLLLCHRHHWPLSAYR